MSRWFRVYDDAINDPKILRLPEAGRWHWIAVLAIASKNDGSLPALDDIALMLRKSKQATTAILDMLKNAGLLDEAEDGLTPHNWNGRQFKSDVSTERVKRFRNAQRNVSSAVSETPPDTESETEQNTDAPAADAAHSVSDPPANPEKQFFDQAQQTLGRGGRSLAAALLKAKGGNVALAHSALLMASQKSEPREYLGAIIRGRGDSPEDLRARGEAW